MMMTRRTLIQGSVALAIAGGARAVPAVDVQGTADAQLARLLQKLAEEYLHRSPEEATAFDFDTGANAELRRKLDDRSLDAVARDRTGVDRALADLARID